jgi:ferredoxin
MKISQSTQSIYDNRPNKDIVEKKMMITGRRILGYGNKRVNCLTVCCDRYQLHVERLFKCFAKKVFIVERAEDKLKTINAAAKNCRFHKNGKVKIIPLDADEFTLNDCQFMDLDIDGTLGTSSKTIKKHALTQRNDNNHSRKVFAFAFSGRYKTDLTFSELHEILRIFDVFLTGFDGVPGGFGKGKSVPKSVNTSSRSKKNPDGKLRYCKKLGADYTMLTKNVQIEEIIFHKYDDGMGPMGHIVISYRT